MKGQLKQYHHCSTQLNMGDIWVANHPFRKQNAINAYLSKGLIPIIPNRSSI